MTNNTLKSTIEAIIATGALVTVTLDGTFNSKTGTPILSPRTGPDQRNKFLKDFCERVNPAEAKDAENTLTQSRETVVESAKAALVRGEYALASKLSLEAVAITEQLDQPRVYYTIKPNVDLRTVGEKRAAKKAENAAKKATKQAEKEAAAAAKMAEKVEPAQQTTQIAEAPKSSKTSTKKAA
jgi:hypothetical protein